MENEIKILEGYYSLLAATIQTCFSPYNKKRNQQAEYYERKIFLNSKMVKMWCDCSDNFTHEKLIKQFEGKKDQQKNYLKIYNNFNQFILPPTLRVRLEQNARKIGGMQKYEIPRKTYNYN